MEQADGVGGKQLPIAAGLAEPKAEVLGGVVRDERLDLEAVVDPRVERAIAAQGETVTELGDPDEDEGEERATIPSLR